MHFKRLSCCELERKNRPSRSQKLAKLACVQLLLTPLATAAEIPIDRAIDRAIETAQIGDLSEAARRESRSYRRAAATLPNPSIFYERETLNGSGPDSDSRETTFGVAAPLDFIWKRAARVEAAELRGQLAELQIEDQRRQLAKEVAMLFVEYAANQLEYQRHEAVHIALDRAKLVAKASVDTGDAPPTLLQRVDVAIARHAFEENRLQSDRLVIRSHFAALLGNPEASPEIGSIAALHNSVSSEARAKEEALQNRPDLRAAQALVGWKQAEQQAARREGLPDVSLEAAQKEDNVGRDGVYLGLSVELPIFDRNQGASDIAAAESLRAELTYRQIHRKVEAEASSAFLRWKTLDDNWRNLAETLALSRNAEALLVAGEASFEAGESSLLEYLDTVEAYLEAAEQEIKLQRDLRLAAIELASVTATTLQTN